MVAHETRVCDHPRVARLKALLVDVGGTLVDDQTWLPEDRYNELRLRRLAAVFGEERAWFQPFVAERFPEGDAPEYEQRTADAVLTFLRRTGIEPSAEEVERICRAAAPPLSEVVELARNAREAMHSARALGLRVAICSNTLWRSDDDSRRDWTDLGFGDCFDAYVTSHSTGRGKPHRAIFDRCLTALGVRPEETAHLGDRPERDVAGARALGIRAIWKRPPDFDGPCDPPPDAEISDLAELAPILRRWTGG